MQPAQTISLAAAGVCTVACGIGLAFALRRWPGVDLRRHASRAQTAFCFNSTLLGMVSVPLWLAVIARL